MHDLLVKNGELNMALNWKNESYSLPMYSTKYERFPAYSTVFAQVLSLHSEISSSSLKVKKIYVAVEATLCAWKPEFTYVSMCWEENLCPYAQFCKNNIVLSISRQSNSGWQKQGNYCYLVLWGTQDKLLPGFKKTPNSVVLCFSDWLSFSWAFPFLIKT